MKRKMSNITIEELISIVAESVDVPTSPEKTDVSEFIAIFRLVPGRKKVSFNFLHKAYRIWSLKPTRKTTLGRELSKRFKRSRSRYEVFYYIGN